MLSSLLLCLVAQAQTELAQVKLEQWYFIDQDAGDSLLVESEEYDRHGNLIRSLRYPYQKSAAPSYTTTYQYDEHHHAVVTISSRPTGTDTIRTQYDNAGNEIARTVCCQPAYTSSSRGVRNEHGDWVQLTIENGNGEVKHLESSYTYDDVGNQLTSTEYLILPEGKNKLNERTESRYNAAGMLTYHYLDWRGLPKRLQEYTTYRYDSMGREIERTYYEKGSKKLKEVTRTIYNEHGQKVRTIETNGKQKQADNWMIYNSHGLLIRTEEDNPINTFPPDDPQPCLHFHIHYTFWE